MLQQALHQSIAMGWASHMQFPRSIPIPIITRPRQTAVRADARPIRVPCSVAHVACALADLLQLTARKQGQSPCSVVIVGMAFAAAGIAEEVFVAELPEVLIEAARLPHLVDVEPATQALRGRVVGSDPVGQGHIIFERARQAGP